MGAAATAASRRHSRLLTDEETSSVLPGFEHVNRYWDASQGQVTAKILPGEYYVSTEREQVVTVLGSCVSACIRDPLFGVGGMNHFMLPESSKTNLQNDNSAFSASTRYGNFAMEHLINVIIEHGGRRNHLEIKIIGGGQVVPGMSDVGKRNIEFVRSYLNIERMLIVGEDVGGIYPRKVYYDPKSGKVRVKLLKDEHNDTLFAREKQYSTELRKEPLEGEIELF